MGLFLYPPGPGTLPGAAPQKLMEKGPYSFSLCDCVSGRRKGESRVSTVVCPDSCVQISKTQDRTHADTTPHSPSYVCRAANSNVFLLSHTISRTFFLHQSSLRVTSHSVRIRFQK